VRALRSFLVVASLLVVAGLPALGQTPAPPAAQTAEIGSPFAGREAQIEECLETAPIVKQSSLSIGITRPSRIWFEPCAGVTSAAWKPIRPASYRGFWESYKSEIAAYELDQHLGLRMVPPSVERKVNGISGAVIMWLDNMRMWKEVESNKPVTPRWNRQMVQMKMFDALIGNIDRNSGNALIDADWNVYLIDHSRAFVTSSALPVQFLHVDADLWAKMRALDKDGLMQVLGRRLERRAIDAILTRRDKMAREINKLVAERGAERVFIRE